MAEEKDEWHEVHELVRSTPTPEEKLRSHAADAIRATAPAAPAPRIRRSVWIGAAAVLAVAAIVLGAQYFYRPEAGASPQSQVSSPATTPVQSAAKPPPNPK